jgi:hypothetical protein
LSLRQLSSDSIESARDEVEDLGRDVHRLRVLGCPYSLVAPDQFLLREQLDQLYQEQRVSLCFLMDSLHELVAEVRLPEHGG